MQRRQAPVLNGRIVSKRGTLWSLLLSSISDTSGCSTPHFKELSPKFIVGKSWNDSNKIEVNEQLHQRCLIWAAPLPLFDKPAILGCDISIYSPACWNFLPCHSKSPSRQMRRQRLEVKHQGLRAGCVLSWAFLFPERRAGMGTERKTQNRHSSADRKDWALSEATVPQCAAWSFGNGEGGMLLCE